MADPDAVDPNGYPLGTMALDMASGVLMCQRYGADHYREDIDAVRHAAPQDAPS